MRPTGPPGEVGVFGELVLLLLNLSLAVLVTDYQNLKVFIHKRREIAFHIAR